MYSNTIKADKLPGYKTDHLMTTLHLSLHSDLQGQGFWKVSSCFLKDDEYVNQRRGAITWSADEYSQDNTHCYPRAVMGNVWNENRKASINYGKSNKKCFTIEGWHWKINKNPRGTSSPNISGNNPQILWTQLDRKTCKHETLIQYQTKGGILRSNSHEEY